MNIKRRSKLERQLSCAEIELSALLGSTLPRVATSGEQLFFNSRFLPSGHLARWLPSESEPLLLLADEIVSLREELGVAVDGTLAHLFLAACAEASDTTQEHRRGPRQLAANLLGKLTAHAA